MDCLKLKDEILILKTSLDCELQGLDYKLHDFDEKLHDLDDKTPWFR